jgi:hypothetical protein
LPPKARPRPYTTLDRDYLAQDTIRELGGEHGPAGPLVFLALILNAGKAISSQAPDAIGRVEMRWRTLAGEAWVGVEEAREIVRMAVDLDLVAEFVELDGGRFSARLTKAARWESRPLTGAERTAQWRERKAEGRDARDEEPSQ